MIAQACAWFNSYWRNSFEIQELNKSVCAARC